MVNSFKTGASKSVLSRIQQFEKKQSPRAAVSKDNVSNTRESPTLDPIDTVGQNGNYASEIPQAGVAVHSGSIENNVTPTVSETPETWRLVLNQRRSAKSPSPVAEKVSGPSSNLIGHNQRKSTALENTGVDVESHCPAKEDKGNLWQIRNFQRNDTVKTNNSRIKLEASGKKPSNTSQQAESDASENREQRTANSQQHSEMSIQTDTRITKTQSERTTTNHERSNSIIKSRMQIFSHSPTADKHEENRSLRKSPTKGVTGHHKKSFVPPSSTSSFSNPRIIENNTEAKSLNKTPKFTSDKMLRTSSPSTCPENVKAKIEPQNNAKSPSPRGNPRNLFLNVNECGNQNISQSPRMNQTNGSENIDFGRRTSSPWSNMVAKTETSPSKSPNKTSGIRQNRKVVDLRIQTDTNANDFGSSLKKDVSSRKAQHTTLECRTTPNSRTNPSPKDTSQSDSTIRSPRMKSHVERFKNSPRRSPFKKTRMLSFNSPEDQTFKKQDSLNQRESIEDTINDDESSRQNPSPESSIDASEQRKYEHGRKVVESPFHQKISSKDSPTMNETMKKPLVSKKNDQSTKDTTHLLNEKDITTERTKLAQDQTYESPKSEIAGITSDFEDLEMTPVRNNTSKNYDVVETSGTSNPETSIEVRQSPRNSVDTIIGDGELKTRLDFALEEDVKPTREKEQGITKTSSPSEKSNSSMNSSPLKRDLFVRASRLMKQRQSVKDRKQQNIRKSSPNYRPLSGTSSESRHFSFENETVSPLSKSMPTTPLNQKANLSVEFSSQKSEDRSPTLNTSLSPRSHLAANLSRLKVIREKRLERQKQNKMEPFSDTFSCDELSVNESMRDTFEVTLNNSKLLEPSQATGMDGCTSRTNMLCGQQGKLLNLSQRHKELETSCLNNESHTGEINPQVKSLLESSVMSLKDDSINLDNCIENGFASCQPKLHAEVPDDLSSCTGLSAVSDMIPNFRQVSSYFLGKEDKTQT